MYDSEIVQSGKYRFKIIRHIERYSDDLWAHTYKLGGDYQNCVNVSYLYKDNKPYGAIIPHLLYEPECVIGSSLESGGGSEIMIKTALRYAFNDVKTLPKFEFDDMSHIDCIAKDLTVPPPRKNIKPLNLAYFYIAYHSMTWYEARFNAVMMDKIKYAKYRKKLTFLTDPTMKPSFGDFNRIIKLVIESVDTIKYIEKLYNNTKTYREFFEAIPKSRRCEILYPWLNTFMIHYIGDVFSVYNWVIDVEKMDIAKNISIGGSLKKGPHYRIFSYQVGSSLGPALSF